MATESTNGIVSNKDKNIHEKRKQDDNNKINNDDDDENIFFFVVFINNVLILENTFDFVFVREIENKDENDDKIIIVNFSFFD